MRVYLAARFSRRAEISGYAHSLRTLGIEVTSRWLTDPEHRVVVPPGQPATDIQLFNANLALHDQTDLTAAETVIYFAPGGTRGGCHVEFGMALALGKRLILVGVREHVFTWLPEVVRYATWAECFEAEFTSRPVHA